MCDSFCDLPSELNSWYVIRPLEEACSREAFWSEKASSAITDKEVCLQKSLNYSIDIS